MTGYRWVAIFYILTAIVVGMFLENVLRSVWGFTGLPDTQFVGDTWTLTTVIGFGLAFGVAGYLWLNEKTRTASMEIWQELRKVTWPGMDETRVETIAVIVTSIIIAVILGLFDFGWGKVTALIYEAPRYLGG